MASLESVNAYLEKSARLIDHAADEMKSIAVKDKDDYVLKIATILNGIHDIQRDIYELEPGLQPEYLNEESRYPEDNREYGEVLISSKELQTLGDNMGAISVVEKFLLKKRPDYLKMSAKKLIQQYRNSGM